MISKQVETGTRCAHCGDVCPTGQIRLDDKLFCCAGCKSVYLLLQESNLCEYYTLNDHPGLSQQYTARPNKFAFLDLPDITSKLVQYTDRERTHVTFYIPQMHCSSCLWLLENLHRLQDGIISSRVDFSKKELFVVFHSQHATLRSIAELLTRIGYEPHLSVHQLANPTLAAPDRTRWYKLGIAGFCFGNIMMLSLPEYFGGATLDPALKSAFTLLIVLLSLPVILYSAGEFFVSAWKGLRERYLNIDAPIALALLITFGRSLYEILTGAGPGYLDSMSGIVFFMLIGRWLQDKTYRTISFDRDYRSFFPIAVNVLQQGKTVITPIEKIAVDDHIKLHHGELLPADGILIRGKAEIDYSFVTGESIPVAVGTGEIIYAGGKQTGEAIEVRVAKGTSQSYLTQLWNRHGGKAGEPPYHSFIDGLSRYFTYIVFAIGAVAAGYWWMQGQPLLMWNALTTILIVACPCALLLSANFTRGNMLRILSREKLYLRHADVLEKMAGIDAIVFDKTGTITRKDEIDIRYDGNRLDAKTKSQLAAVLANSTHPLSLAVYHALGITTHAATTDVKITAGKGIEGWIDDRYIRIGSPAFTGVMAQDADGSAACIVIDQQPVGTFYVRNAYRNGIFDMLRSLGRQFRIAMLSGDNDTEAAKLHSELGNTCELQFFRKPVDKLQYIEALQANGHKVMMVGDGLNDAAALQQSDVGIAITEDDNNFTPAADGILHASGVARLGQMMRYARAGRTIILTSFILSIMYNIIGLYFAVQGILSPVIAAILMPISSVSIILLTYSMSGWIWRRQKQVTP